MRALTLFLSSTTPSSVSLLPIPLALSCRTFNVLSSLICSAEGAGIGGGEGGDGWVFVRSNRGHMSSHYFSDTVLHLRLVTFRVHTGQGYLEVELGFGPSMVLGFVSVV